MALELLRGTYLGVVSLLLVALTFGAQSVQGQDINSEDAQRLILSIYLDRTGNALVTGYADSPEVLSFLNSSQYSYDNETNQLYAITNALTKKDGDNWTLNFESFGFYRDYHLAFVLPDEFRIKNINGSQGVPYLLSASNDSLVVDFQGYDIQNPSARIEYQQPIEIGAVQTSGRPYFLPFIMILAILVSATFLWFNRARQLKRPSTSQVNAETLVRYQDKVLLDDKISETEVQPSIATNKEKDEFSDIPETIALSKPTGQVQQDEEDLFSALELAEEEMGDAEALPQSAPDRKIEISSEMAAVMETLTPRERAILQALIDRGGRATQADLRYETRTPKSSLTGIVYSLERRKLITKKEWGRTNVIELSDWFLSKKNGS
ncbi:MAG: hypothetical protein MUO26_12445 [Methanotrichaceae archaeon]|nr:hypothetical protein [Methanotrichaceae archaeon]